jgi:hypothetical protein
METKQPEDEVELLLSRDGIVKEITVQLALNHRVNYKIEPMENPGKLQLKIRNKWLQK